MATTERATTGDGLTAETLAAVEDAVLYAGSWTVAETLGRAPAVLMEHVPALLAEVRRLTAALDGARREERSRCRRECMVVAGELSYDFRLRQGMHAAERCAKTIAALPDDATGSAT